MTATETVLVNGEPTEVKRLDAGDELHEREIAVWDRYGNDVSDDDFDRHMSQCRVYYRDNHDEGTSEYTVDDAAGGYAYGWHRVK